MKPYLDYFSESPTLVWCRLSIYEQQIRASDLNVKPARSCFLLDKLMSRQSRIFPSWPSMQRENLPDSEPGQECWTPESKDAGQLQLETKMPVGARSTTVGQPAVFCCVTTARQGRLTQCLFCCLFCICCITCEMCPITIPWSCGQSGSRGHRQPLHPGIRSKSFCQHPPWLRESSSEYRSKHSTILQTVYGYSCGAGMIQE
jgi:hypothetical protein